MLNPTKIGIFKIFNWRINICKNVKLLFLIKRVYSSGEDEKSGDHERKRRPKRIQSSDDDRPSQGKYRERDRDRRYRDRYSKERNSSDYYGRDSYGGRRSSAYGGGGGRTERTRPRVTITRVHGSPASSRSPSRSRSPPKKRRNMSPDKEHRRSKSHKFNDDYKAFE